MRLVKTLLLAMFLLFSAAGINTAMAANEWGLYNQAESLEQAGDLEGAMKLWEPLVGAMLAIGEDEAAGFCAQKMGRALDKLGRYEEAVKYYDQEIEIWNKLPGHADWTWVDTHRAKEIRPEMKVFVEEAATGSPVRALAKHEPVQGTLLGASVTGDPAVGYDLDRVPSVYGRPYASVLVYVSDWHTYVDETLMKLAKQKGLSLQVAWEPSQGLSAVTDDHYLRSFAGDLKEYGLPVFLRFAAEMNGDWAPWSGNPGLYIEKFRLVSKVMREEAPNVAMVWSPNYYPDDNVDAYYPGDQWVDWVGINAYSDYYFNGNPSFSESVAAAHYQGCNANPLHKFKDIYNRYASRKPIMICETGVAWANRYPYVDVSDWGANNLGRVYSYLPLVYPQIKAIYNFNYDISNKGPDYPAFSHYLISGNEKMLRAYRLATASQWYLDKMQQSSPLRYRAVEGAVPGNAKKLVSYISLASGVSRVDYLFNGSLIGSATAPPWPVNVDFSRTGPGVLEVKAYDKNGKQGASRAYDVTAPALPPVKVELNGRIMSFDVAPVEIEGRVLVPVRAILEALGVEVGWEEATRTVIARKGTDELRLQVGNLVPVLNGRSLPALDVPARVIGGRTMVPVRFVSENFNMDVDWDGENRKVIIRSR
ncbi:MAG: stalk domain-containing protein [Desulfotomaculaceae bacterium]|nr:stalk domain-containing protein [Desulfotomaculaceae bacterium]